MKKCIPLVLLCLIFSCAPEPSPPLQKDEDTTPTDSQNDLQYDRYIICENANMSGILIVDSRTGLVMRNDFYLDQQIIYEQAIDSTSTENRTFLPCENLNGSGLFITNSKTGESYWTNSNGWKNYGRPPQSEEGEINTYIPYKNTSGGMFFVLNQLTGQLWWVGGEENWIEYPSSEISYADLDKRGDEFRIYFENREAEDQSDFTPDQITRLYDLERLVYDNWGKPTAIDHLTAIINTEEFIGMNRYGLALHDMYHHIDDDTKITYLLRAHTEYPDSWWGNGVNLGAHSAYDLYLYYTQNGDTAAAAPYLQQIKDNFLDYICHSGYTYRELLKL